MPKCELFDSTSSIKSNRQECCALGVACKNADKNCNIITRKPKMVKAYIFESRKCPRHFYLYPFDADIDKKKARESLSQCPDCKVEMVSVGWCVDANCEAGCNTCELHNDPMPSCSGFEMRLKCPRCGTVYEEK